MALAWAPRCVWLNSQFLRLCKPLHNRKNYLSRSFASSDLCGDSTALIYSVIGTARLNGVDPYAYLRAVLECIGTHPINRIDELLPWNMVLDNEQGHAQAA